MKGRITKIEKSEGVTEYEVELLSGEDKGEKVEIQMMDGQNLEDFMVNYEVGQTVFVERAEIEDHVQYSIADHARTWPLFLLFVIFVALVAAIGRKRGIGALVGLAISGLVLFLFTIPMLSAGHSAVLIGIVSLIVILIPTMYFSHGFNPKTTTALIGTLISLILAGVLGVVFIHLVKLSGLGNEDARNLAIQSENVLSFSGILLFSLILGTLGVIDDVTVSQVSTVREIIKAKPNISMAKLYKSAMNVGVDHIASMVNTLIMAYVGSAMPLVMLFHALGTPVERILSIEFIAEEVVRMLVGSIGLVLAVPVTTILASYLVTQPERFEKWVKD